MLRLFLIVNIALAVSGRGYSRSEVVNTLYKWKQMDFKYPSEREKLEAIANGDFNQANVIPLGIERWRDRVFISTPRWKKGTPATLSSLPTVAVQDSPPLKPYPSWDWHNADNCTGLTSVFRMSVDHCGVMWVLDSGTIEAFETPRQLCPPTIIAIDLETDTVLGRYPIPDQFVLQNSLITNIVVDSRDDDCKDLHLYVADAWRFGLIVFRKSDAAFWRFDHFTFFPEPLLSNYTLHGLNYQVTDGIFGMSLGKINSGDRSLYYHAMSSSLEFVVSTSIIRDPTRINNAVNEFKLLGESRGPESQLSAAAIDRNGVMFYSLISQDSIGCWHTSTEYANKNLGIVAKSDRILVYPNDLRIDQEVQQNVWVITNKLPMYQFNLIDPNEDNYRVLYFDPVKAVKNTVCQSPF
ncbi:dopaminechrome tautomerase-like [Battus philenor]|uniref:dopaminechrome tautomerase-like n=1 Tax=Battus philenor TaxID=42288 RepID=UPI0035CFE594